MNHEKPRILQLSVRLSEGGAAGVARTLHDQLPHLGYAPTFAYGYGPRGSNSPMETAIGARKTTPRVAAATNLLTHRYLDTELRAPNLLTLRRLRRLIDEVDLVHVHILHSYYIHTTSAMEMLASAGKPLVWTLHDQWVLTGRCALPGDCQGWRTGCDPCRDLNAYPPSSTDRAARGFILRRQHLAQMANTLPMQFVACANWLEHLAASADIGPVTSIHNSVDSVFWNASQRLSLTRSSSSVAKPRRTVFLSRDLRDSVKIDWDFLRLLSEIPGQELTIVGDNAPDDGPKRARYVPAVGDRAELASLLAEHDQLVFTSTVDHYPLTVAEALVSGLTVLALDSPAIREFRSFDTVRAFKSTAEILAHIAQSEEDVGKASQNAAINYFDPARMASEYAALYDRLL